jgi:Tol biopolymer transport system component
MALTTGTKLAAYEILAPLGAGGMGEVYRARDTRLDRTVAIKVLPAHLAGQQDLRDRFEREARVVSGLNHPHICTLYDIGRQDDIDFLVMEYLEGETLASRLKNGPLPLDQAMKTAVEIADALDKAHRKGVTHRDLKPGNIMLTKGGAKLLDFGLAKFTPEQGGTLHASKAPTADFSKELTAQGTILGTLQYMSPEQLEGLEVDARSDIFAFGAVLYEMLTGRKAFVGRSQSSVIAAIMHVDPPDVSTLQPLTPPAIDRVIRICLAKDPSDRWQTAHDLALQLQWIAEGGSQAGIPIPVAARRRHRERLAWALFGFATLLAAVAAIPAAMHFLEVNADPPVRFEIQTPTMNNPFQVAVSPDGRKVAFVASVTAGVNQLYVRHIDSVSAQVLPGTEGAIHPFWSADSKSIGFGVPASKLKRVDAGGGAPQSLCDLASSFYGGTWNTDNEIIFSQTDSLYRVSAAGGIAQQISSRDESSGETSKMWPRFLPDGRHYLYLSWNTHAEKRAVYVGDLDSPKSVRLFPSGSMAAFAAPGFIIFQRDGTLLSQAFDPRHLELRGEVVRLAEDIPFNSGNGRAAFDVSAGTLVYRSDASIADPKLKLTWVDRNGKVTGTVAGSGGYQGPDISPDGKRIAIHRHDEKGGDVWVIETPEGKAGRRTFDASQENSMPLWSKDGRYIVFGSLRNGKWGIYKKQSNGVGSEELLFESDDVKMPMSWSDDGNIILFFVANAKTNNDVWALQLTTGERKAIPVLQTTFTESHPQISPDGKWFAYSSNETGRSEIYIQSFPPGAGKWQISTNGGVFSRWRPDGRELFYQETASFGNLMAVKIQTTGTSLESSTPVALFETEYNNGAIRGHTGNWNTFAVSADGNRFLIPRPESTGSRAPTPAPITVVLNWTSTLPK